MTRARLSLLVPTLTLLLVAASCGGENTAANTITPNTLAKRPAAAAEPIDAAALLGDAEARLDPGPADRCPVCGMRPAARPESVAAAVAIDGSSWYFCGNGCLLRCHLHPQTYLGLDADRLAEVLVQDYFTGSVLRAAQAWWIAGSDVVGPMGPALVAVGSEADVAAFRRRHGGEHVFRLAELDDARYQEITGRRADR